jgi:gliding motility-associated-like protein
VVQAPVPNAGGIKSITVTPVVTTVYKIESLSDKYNCPFAGPFPSITIAVGSTNAVFDTVGPKAACSPFTASFSFDQKTDVTYEWTFGDGEDSTFVASTNTTGSIITHTYNNLSTKNTTTPRVLLVETWGGRCRSDNAKSITLYPTILTNIFPDKTEMCSGEVVTFRNNSSGVPDTGSRWFYRHKGNNSEELDVKTTRNVNFTLSNSTTTNPIIYEVVYQATNGNCPAPEVITPITVYRGIEASFVADDIPALVGGHSLVPFTNTSVPIDPTQFRYEWDFGFDGTPATATGTGPFTVDYVSPGPRDVVLAATNIAAEAAGLPCTSMWTVTVNVPLLPLIAAFTAVPGVSCYPSSITVTGNTSTGDIMDWRLIDNNGRISATSNAPTPVFQVNEPGKYTLSLKTSSSLTGQVAVAPIQSFEVFDKPLASFDVRPDVVYVPDTEMNTFNFSFGATDYFWDFGDNGTSTEFQPTYTYKIEGKYDITLIAKNDHGDGVICADTLKHSVLAKQGGLTKVPNAFTPNPNGPNGGVSTNGSFNDVFLPIVKGVEEFNMQIYDRWGNLVFESNSANIGWDGYNKDGRLMPAGVYVYKLTVRLSDNQRSTQIGDITMIR